MTSPTRCFPCLHRGRYDRQLEIGHSMNSCEVQSSQENAIWFAYASLWYHYFWLDIAMPAQGLWQGKGPPCQSDLEAFWFSLTLFLALQVYFLSCSRVLRRQKLKTRLLRTHSSKVLPGVCQNTALHASPTAWNSLPANFYYLRPFTFIFSKTAKEMECQQAKHARLCTFWHTADLNETAFVSS